MELSQDLQNKINAVAVTSQINKLLIKVALAVLTGQPYDDIKAEYESKLAAVDDAVALCMPDYFPAWDGNGVTYEVGQRVVYKDVLYKVITGHTSQTTWTPVDAPSLFTKVLTSDDGTPLPWEQPDSTNPYMKGDKVLYNGKVYESLIDNNVWSPDGYPAGWKEIGDSDT